MVLTGGRSSRMGRDKALLELPGRPALAVVAARALAGAGARPVLAIGGDLDGLRAAGLDARPDAHPDQGPLGGLVTARALLTASPQVPDTVVVLACDMPDVDAGVVRSLLAALAADPTADAARASVAGRDQPLTAAYRRRALDHLQLAFTAGERSVRRAGAGLHQLSVAIEPGARVADVDGPADLRRYARPS